MVERIKKSDLENILRKLWKNADDEKNSKHRIYYNKALQEVQCEIDTLEVKETETNSSPSRKQLEALKDLLDYNIGVFDYQKFMEVYSLYNDLIKL